MKPVFSDNAKKIIMFLQENKNFAFSLQTLCEKLEMESKIVNGVLVGLQRKKLVTREEDEATGVKMIFLTAKGLEVDPLEETE